MGGAPSLDKCKEERPIFCSECGTCPTQCPPCQFGLGNDHVYVLAWANANIADRSGPQYAQISLNGDEFLIDGNPTCVTKSTFDGATAQMAGIFQAHKNGGVHPQCPVEGFRSANVGNNYRLM